MRGEEKIVYDYQIINQKNSNIYLALRIGDAAADVRPVDGRRVCDILPVLLVQIVVILVAGRCVSIGFAEFRELFHVHRLLLDVHLLVESRLAGHHLANGRRNLQRNRVQVVAAFARNPFLGWNNLKFVRRFWC